MNNQKKTTSLFVDNYFSHMKKDKKGYAIKWPRPKDLVPEPCLFAGMSLLKNKKEIQRVKKANRGQVQGKSIQINPVTINQGSYINSKLWSTIASLAVKRPHEITNIFVDPEQDLYPDGPNGNYTGRISFKFYRNNELIRIDIDDRLPLSSPRRTSSSKSTYLSSSSFDIRKLAHSTIKNEFWPTLLEKALAKFYGSYENLEASKINWPATNQAGNACEIDSATFDTLDGLHGVKICETLCNKIIVSEISSILLRLSLSAKDFGTQLSIMIRDSFACTATVKSNASLMRGSIENPTYAVLDYKELYVNQKNPDHSSLTDKRLLLIKLYNPWSQIQKLSDKYTKGVWHGRYADGISEKGKLPKPIDGCFWMLVEDFLENFNEIQITLDLKTENCIFQSEGEFSPKIHSNVNEFTFENKETYERYSNDPQQKELFFVFQHKIYNQDIINQGNSIGFDIYFQNRPTHLTKLFRPERTVGQLYAGCDDQKYGNFRVEIKRFNDNFFGKFWIFVFEINKSSSGYKKTSSIRSNNDEGTLLAIKKDERLMPVVYPIEKLLVCTFCDNIIKHNSKVFTVGNQNYHRECLRCLKCKNLLEEEIYFIYGQEGGREYRCKTCFSG